MPDEPQREPPSPLPPKKPENIGPTAAILIIIILLALGGLYYFTTSAQKIQNNSEIQNETGAPVTPSY